MRGHTFTSDAWRTPLGIAMRPLSIINPPWPSKELRPRRGLPPKRASRKLLRNEKIKGALMQRLLMVSTLALAMAASALLAQKPPAPKSKAELQAVQAMYA